MGRKLVSRTDLPPCPRSVLSEDQFDSFLISQPLSSFFAHEDTPDSVPRAFEEIRCHCSPHPVTIVLRLVIKGKKDVLCNPPTNPVDESYGWCKTQGDYYSIDNWKEVHNGWGYCGADCYNDQVCKHHLGKHLGYNLCLQKEDVMDSGMIRTKSNIHILSEKLCDHYLAQTLEDNRAKVKVLTF